MIRFITQQQKQAYVFVGAFMGEMYAVIVCKSYEYQQNVLKYQDRHSNNEYHVRFETKPELYFLILRIFLVATFH